MLRVMPFWAEYHRGHGCGPHPHPSRRPRPERRGDTRQAVQPLSFAAEARAFVHALGLPSFAAWRRWATSPARPTDIPSDPDRAYAQAGWTDWADWLGTEHPRGRRPADRGAGHPLALG